MFNNIASLGCATALGSINGIAIAILTGLNRS